MTHLCCKMDDLKRCMQIIDENSEKIYEGDYLELCQLLKSAYNKRADPVYFFTEREDFIPSTSELTHEMETHMSEYLMDRSYSLDEEYLNDQIGYLQNEYDYHKPLNRLTKRLKGIAKSHFVMAHNLTVEQTEELTGAEITDITRKYMRVENAFREDYRAALLQKMDWLMEAHDRLGNE